jgi:glycerophosphoryl diester phosphodiesterase
VKNLKHLKQRTRLPLIQLLRSRPDELIFDTNMTVTEATSDKGLADIAEYAFGIGPGKDAIRPPTADGYAGPSTGLVARAHAAGLAVRCEATRSHC